MCLLFDVNVLIALLDKIIRCTHRQSMVRRALESGVGVLSHHPEWVHQDHVAFGLFESDAGPGPLSERPVDSS